MSKKTFLFATVSDNCIERRWAANHSERDSSKSVYDDVLLCLLTKIVDLQWASNISIARS